MNISLHIPDMTCGHCVRTITSAIQGVAPAATVQADLATHTVQVDGAPDRAAILAAIGDAGYAVEAG